jgi:Adenylate and Guanylate cyclase catalytic domain
VLLETIFQSFDEISLKYNVFKVETVGDCYVAVTGLPQPRKDHAILMARFARQCMNKMKSLTKELEVVLGPDTGDLALRVGMHSGPVTAGVLRGSRRRFQLFGDTVNTASRMETTGMRNRVHISQETAQLLIDAGKENWIRKRDDAVEARGKGTLSTYWLQSISNLTVNDLWASSNGKADRKSIGRSQQWENSEVDWSLVELDLDEKRYHPHYDDKAQRLIEWNTDVLSRLLRQIISRRNVYEQQGISTISDPDDEDLKVSCVQQSTVLDEVTEIIHLPDFDRKIAKDQQDPDDIELGDEVERQLKEYILSISTM